MMNSALPPSPGTKPAVEMTVKNVGKTEEDVDLTSFAETLEQQEVGRDSGDRQGNSAVESLPADKSDELQAGSPPGEGAGKNLPDFTATLPVESGDAVEGSPPHQLGLAAQPQGLQVAAGSGLKATSRLARVESDSGKVVNLLGAGSSVGPLDAEVGQARSARDPLAIQELASTKSPRSVETAQPLVAKSLDEQGVNATGLTRAMPGVLSTALPSAALSAAGLPGAINPTAENNSAPWTKLELPVVEMPPASPRWGGAIAQRAQIAILQGVQQAEIRLTPAHLGTIEMHIQMQDERASVTMISPHASVREMLETATPKLRELLEQQGMTLQQNLVSDHSPDPGKSEHQGDSGLVSGAGNDDSEEVIVSPRSWVSAGLVDHYV